MKNFAKTMLFLFVLGTTLGASAEPAMQSFQSANGYVVQYGSQFKSVKQKAELSLIHLGGEAEKSTPALVLTSQKTKPGQSPKKIFERTASRLKIKHKATGMVTNSPTNINGASFYSATYNRTTPKGNKTSCRTYNYYNPKTGLNVFALAVAPSKNSAKYLADFHAVIKTFRLK